MNTKHFANKLDKLIKTPHKALFPLTRMHRVLDTLALPLHESWRLQQKGILLAVIRHQYALHKIRQLNNAIQTNRTNKPTH